MSTPRELLKRKFRSAWPQLDERTRRIMAATEAVSLGYGGVSMVALACGLSRKAIGKGIREIQGGGKPLVGRIRRPGAGRKSITESDPRLVQTLEGLIDEQTLGDPVASRRWVCNSRRPSSTAFTTLDATPDLSTLERTMTPVLSPWLQFEGGGARRADAYIRTQGRS